VFRIAFGVVLAWHALGYFRNDLIGRLWLEPPFRFSYYGFDWVEPWPGVGLYVHFAALAACGVLIALGLAYRVAATVACIALTYVFLLDQALYLNHVYMMCLAAGLMALAPAHAFGSLDVKLGLRPRSDTVPRWALWLLQFQVAVVYVYGGIAKLNPDWLRGEPVRMWLFRRWEIASEPVVYIVAYGGLAFDLCVVPLILWRRTRVLALVAAVAFHGINAVWFPLGVFPWFMLAATTLLLPPCWPRRFLRVSSRPVETVESHRRPPWVVPFVVAFVAFPLLFPLRHHLYPGDVAWTEEGHRFAWRMRLKEKAGGADFRVRVAGGEHELTVGAGAELTPLQEGTMVNRPDMILQYAHHLARRMERDLGRPVEVRVDSAVSLNGRPFVRLIDPEVDLAAEPRTLGPARWILRREFPTR
jgi:hypothetical protein